MEGHCSTGQRPQWAVVPMEEEEGHTISIVKWIKGQMISWLGHLERMEEDRMHKILHSRTGRVEKKGKTQEKMERGSRKRS